MNLLTNLFSRGKAAGSFLDTYPDAVLFINSDGEICKSNKKAQEMFKLSKHELAQRNISDVIEGGIVIVDNIISKKKIQVGKAVLDDNQILYIEMNAEMNVGANSSRTIITMRDVTEEYIQNADIFTELEDLKNANVDKNAVLVKLSNELQSPLHSMVGFSQALLEQLGGPLTDKQEKYISIINRNSNELLSLLGKIITMSQYENNIYDVEFDHFDLIDFLNNDLAMFKKQAAEKNLVFNIDSEELVRRNCNMPVNLFKVILHNIFETIIRHSASDTVSINLSHPSELILEEFRLNTHKQYDEKSYVLFTITTGSFNILQNEFPYLFEPYMQLDRNNKKYVDTSFSLAIAKKVIEAMQGAIYIEPRGIQGISIGFIIRTEQTENA